MSISLVQHAPVESSGTNPSATFTSATTTGNLLVAILGTGLASGITVPSGWTQRAITQHASTVPLGSLIIASKIADGTETAVAFSAASSTYALEILEFSGNAAAGSYFDAASAGTQQASTVTSIQPGSLTPANANELFIAAEFNGGAGANTGSEAVDSSFTVLDAATFTILIPTYKIKTDSAAENPTISWATARTCFAIQVAFVALVPRSSAFPSPRTRRALQRSR